MKPGLEQKDSYRYMQEMLPLVRELWKGDVEHNGEYWNFPKATSCPKPVQEEVPMWVAARSPITFDYAVKNLTVAISESNTIVTKGELPEVYGDVRKLQQLFQNLIGNAVKYRDLDKQNKVHVTATQNLVVLLKHRQNTNWLKSRSGICSYLLFRL